MIFNLNFQFPSTPGQPGPSIALTIDAPDIDTALESAKEPIKKWAEAHARNLHDALGEPPAIKPEA